MVFEVEVGVDFLDIGGRLEVVEQDIATARKANVTSDCTINAVDGKISGPERFLNTLVPTKKLKFSDLRGWVHVLYVYARGENLPIKSDIEGFGELIWGWGSRRCWSSSAGRCCW